MLYVTVALTSVRMTLDLLCVVQAQRIPYRRGLSACDRSLPNPHSAAGVNLKLTVEKGLVQ